eukprot:TRINITY_DN1993_c0_g1_i1.p2 TRINITY_DN1993_c0_g1~~TRINITY_DN1993_c0_g1_i1.p2  ORF type:complete len:530 (+),score=145.11 TRINITY_DN1993_c0_g1_i1:2285-3874(+)
MYDLCTIQTIHNIFKQNQMSKASSTKSHKVTDDSKEKLEAGKRREELKNLLVTKFQTKYANKSIPLSVILNQVNRFLDTMPLTAQNLQILDDRIVAAIGKGGAKIESKKDEPAHDDDDRLSVMSGASDFVESKTKTKQFLDTKTKQVKGEDGDEVKPKSEEDEWVAIMKFNNALYKEEMKQEQLKKAQKKQFMKSELDKQIKEKRELNKRAKEEEQAYLEYQKKHLKELEELEKKKKEDQKAQIKLEKQTRDKQRKEDALRKKIEQMENKKQDKKLIDRMKQEMELEKKAEQERKELEKTTIKKMMEESMKLKEEQKVFALKEREEDIKRQEQQKKLAELQEKEWKDNLMKKDERNKKLLENALKAAGGKGLKAEEQLADQKMKEQIELLAKKKEEEEKKKTKYTKEKQKEVKAMLDKQVEEKKIRKTTDKVQSQQQAEMWKKDLNLHHEQEQTNLHKQKELNKKHQEYLLKQMELAKKGKGSSTMTEKEYLMNKKLLEELKAKSQAEANQAFLTMKLSPFLAMHFMRV